MPAEKTPGYRLALGRNLACQYMPYFRSAIFSMVVKEMPGLKTMGVTKDGVMYYDPEAISRWTTEEVAAVILHEVSHLLRDHCDRADMMGIPVTDRVGRMGWNIACFPPGEVLPCGQTIEEPKHDTTKVSEFDGDLVVVTHQAGSFRATPDHPVYAIKRENNYYPIRKFEPTWVNASYLTSDHYVLVPKFGVKDVTSIDLSSYIKSGKDFLGRNAFGNRVLKSIPLNVDTAWVIGLWVAEGSASHNARFSLGAHETKLASKTQRILDSVGIKSSFRSYGTRLSLDAGSTPLVSWLKDNCGNVSHSKHIPECVMYNTQDIREAFLRGYVDGGGSTVERGGTKWVTAWTASKFLCNDLVYLASSLGYGCHYNLLERGPRQIGDTWTASHLHLHRVIWSTNSSGKNKRYFITEEGVWYPVKAVTREYYSGLVYNLVNTPKHTYVLNGVLVHNCDAEINDDLQDAGVKLPGEAIMPETLGMDRGLSAEQYYQNARKMAQDSADQAEQLLKDAMSGWEITEDGKVRNPETGEEIDPNAEGDQEGEGKKPGEKGSQCGGAAGNPMPHENPDGTDAEGDGKSAAQMNAVRKQVAKAVQEEVAKGRGSVPAGLSRWADTQLAPPKVDWRRKLSQCIRTACAFRPGAVDFKYDRPSRRQGAFGYRNAPVLPALRRPVPRVSVAIDTSGSMGPGELETALQETNGILKGIGAEVSMYICDARTEGRVRVRDVKDLKNHLLGGGGTSFIPVFDAVEKERPRPEVLIFITDGGGPAPKFCPPGLKVIWCLVGRHREFPCDWGTFIEIDDDE